MASSCSTLCGLCEIRHTTNKSVVWCPECEEALCNGCHDHHSISKASRNHKTIPINDYQKLPSFILDIKLFCEDHSEKYQNYCLTHEQPLCKKCIVTKHKNCKDIAILDDVTQNAKSSTAFEKIKQNSKDILRKIVRIRQYYEDNISKLNNQKIDIVKQISEIRHTVNQRLDDLEKGFLKELSTVADKIEQRQHDLLQSLQTKEGAINILSDNIDKIKTYASDFQTFLGMKNLERQIYGEDKYFQSLVDDGSLDTVGISYKIDNKLTILATELDKFGEVSMKTSQPPTNILASESDKQAQTPKSGSSTGNLRVKLIKQFEVEGGSDLMSVIGCCIMSNGDFVFTCFTHHILSIHDNNGAFKHTIDLDNYLSFDVTAVDEKTVAVSCGPHKVILFVNTETKAITKMVRTEKPLFGIAYGNGALFYCVESTGLYRMDIKTFESEMVYPETFTWGSYVSLSNGKIYIANYGTNTIKVIDSDFNKTWEFKDETILGSPRGITVDNYGNIFVASSYNNNITVISPLENQGFKMSCDGHSFPPLFGLAFDKTKRVFVTVSDNGKAFILALS